ncbi:MAG TPA: hypothetical protein PKG77_20175 [Phycisphaerae bacterium]|nr:hypothetical protein [Phycisphaerae bacterium]HQL76354.1 hypothetical protein [Phycisphaerae bacterium]
MNNPFMRKIVLTANYQPLASAKLVLSVEISCLPTNASNALFKCGGDVDVPWIPGEWHDFVGIDLSEIQVKGTPGDVVTAVGGSW